LRKPHELPCRKLLAILALWHRVQSRDELNEDLIVVENFENNSQVILV
jgi:hypothetical protein